MEEITKAIFKEDIKYIKENCKKNGDCENCKFLEIYQGCMFQGAPEYWNEELITERVFKK